MGRSRVLISGMGGELGARVASIIEATDWAGDILGLDIDPPRRRLHRARFHLTDPTDAARIEHLVTEFEPDVVVHLAVYEPEARASAAQAATWTPAFADAVFSASARTGRLRRIVVRSGIEVYGRVAHRPDVHTPPAPTSPFGRQLLGVETEARRTGEAAGVSTCIVRLAPVIGAHVPSPLGRVLRQPLVPCSLLRDPSFSVIADADAGAVVAAAAGSEFAGTFHAVAEGSISVRGAIRAGGRLAVPIVGPQWRLARPTSHVLGAPIPDHVHELLTAGRLAEPSDIMAAIGVTIERPTSAVIDALHSWEQVTRIVPNPTAVAS